MKNTKQRISFFFFLTLLFLGVESLFSQTNNIRFQNFSVSNGLSQSSVNQVLQDRKGYIWIATKDGLNRFDAYDFVVFKNEIKNKNSISNNYVNCLLEDKKGNLWIGTNGGLNTYTPQNGKFNLVSISNNYDENSNVVTAIQEDQKGNIFVAVEGQGLKYFSVKDNICTSIELPKSFKKINKIFIDNQQYLWILNDEKIATFNTKNQSIKIYDHKNSRLPFSTIGELLVKKNELWLSAGNQFFKFNYNEESFEQVFSLDKEEQISSFIIDFNKNFWIGTSNEGLFYYETKSKKTINYQHEYYLQNSLIHNNIKQIYNDNSGNIWLATAGGLSTFDPKKQNFSLYRKLPNNSNSLNRDNVWSIYFEEKTKTLWVGTIDGLNKVNTLKNQTVSYKISENNKNQNFIYHIQPKNEKELFIGTADGLFVFDKKISEFTLFSKTLATHKIYTSVRDNSENWWFGTDKGLYLFSKEGTYLNHFSAKKFDNVALQSNAIRALYLDKASNLWIGTDGGGLSFLKAENIDSENYLFKTFTKEREDGKLNNNTILHIYEDTKGYLWLATYGGGINVYDPITKVFTSYTEDDGLSNNVVYAILPDKLENLWMSTNNGITFYDKELRKFVIYNEQDGLQSNEFNTGAFAKSKSGVLFFGGIKGLNQFVPENININKTPPKIIIQQLQVFKKNKNKEDVSLFEFIDDNTSITIPHNKLILTINYSASHFSSPEKNTYAYYLEGFEENWNYVGKRRDATYTNLSPGEYIFKLKAANGDGIWTEKPAVLKIIITPPYWKTWWFITLMGGLFLLTVFGAYRTRVSIIKFQKRILENQVKERTEELYKQKKEVETQKELVEEEKQKVEELLSNILPVEMVDELKSKGKVAARHYRLATIMFADFKGFTKIAEGIRPKELVAKLDRFFIQFDEIIAKNGVEKIKTIGDAYMCAGGLPIRNKSNPVDTVLAGLQIQAYVKEENKKSEEKGEEQWKLRIGINTGELIAGVVGIKRFAYDIWGDSVNTASRLEENGEIGKVNVSGFTYEFIKDFFDCTYRGKVEAKNKGKIDMYFVDRIKKELSADEDGLVPNEEFKTLLNTVLFYEINYKKATAYIMGKLKDEISENFYYHSLEHTVDVVNAAERIANLEGIKGEDILLLKTAAMFHDAGFLVQYKENEVFGAEMAKEALPKFGYNKSQIEKVVNMIMATKIPHQPKNLLEKIICDADLDYLGRDDYYPIAALLGREFMENGIVKNESDWLDMQISFLEKHRYFTESAIRTRRANKVKRLEELKKKKKHHFNQS